MIRYVAGSTKGSIQQGHLFNDPFRLGDVDPQYTSSRVTYAQKIAEDAETQELAMKWTPVVAGTVSITVDGAQYVDDGKGNLIPVAEGSSVSRRTVMVQPVDDAMSAADVRFEGVVPTVETVVTDSTGAVVTTSAGKVDYATGKITLTDKVSGDVQIAYSYNNVLIPQNDIPMLSAKMEMLPLLARARRISIYYSQMAAFQAKTDYGLDLGSQLADKAVG